MGLQRYGVLKGRPVNQRLGTHANAHYQVHLVDDTTDYRIAINVRSKLSPSELEYYIDEDFQYPALAELVDLSLGYTEIPRKPGGLAIDFIRSNMFHPNQMVSLPFDVPGKNNDLNEKIDYHITRAIADEEALIYAFGEPWGPERKKKDKVFGFLPGNGIHNIHMNQGNVGQFVGDDGVYQDGALLIQFPRENQWVAIFLKFQSQTWHTDDRTGQRIETTSVPVPSQLAEERLALEPAGTLRLVAALINPGGEKATAPVVTLLNPSAAAIDLAGWSIADRQKQKCRLTGKIAAGGILQVKLPQQLDVGLQGGAMTLLNPEGLKVTGVSYTANQAAREGWTIVF
jgi:uncharacterized protein YukJ